MKWNELAELICAFISLFVTVIIGKKQSCQSKRMEELERRQDERDERRHAEGNKAQAIEFISKHYADRGLIPLCAVAAMHNDLFHYSRKMYWEFCCLVPEVQNLILEFCNLDLRVRGEDDLFVRCITAVEAALRDRFPEDESVLYDDGKYVLRSLERYAGERLPALRVDLLPECLDSSFLPPDSCTLEYDHLIRKVLSEAFESRDASFTPISHLKNEYQFESSSEIEPADSRRPLHSTRQPTALVTRPTIGTTDAQAVSMARESRPWKTYFSLLSSRYIPSFCFRTKGKK